MSRHSGISGMFFENPVDKFPHLWYTVSTTGESGNIGCRRAAQNAVHSFVHRQASEDVQNGCFFYFGPKRKAGFRKRKPR